MIRTLFACVLSTLFALACSSAPTPDPAPTVVMVKGDDGTLRTEMVPVGDVCDTTCCCWALSGTHDWHCNGRCSAKDKENLP